jgi:hypothetical protein
MKSAYRPPRIFRKRFEITGRQLRRERELPRLERLEADRRIDPILTDRFRDVLGDLFDVHAALAS